MKVRIQANSLRVRLSRPEVAALAAGKIVTQITSFSATARLVSSIETSWQTVVPLAAFDCSRISVILPLEITRVWAGSEEVSIRAEQAIEGQQPLVLLVEKDFECLHHQGENQDAFPNPRKHER